MDPDTQKMLRETLRISRENNEMLHKMRGAQKRAAFWRFIKMLFSLSLLILTYYYLAPYVQSVKESYDSVRASISDIQDARDKLPF